MQYIVSFIEGIITFISPCLLPMLPIYLSYFAGESAVGATNEGETKKAQTGRTLINACGFVLGFSVVFVALGALAGSLGQLLTKYQHAVDIICGMIVILFGLNFCGVIKISILNMTKKPNVNIDRMGFAKAILFGVIFSIGWTPCVGTFLGSALLLASKEGSVLQGVLMLICYSVGLGVPFILSAVLIDKLKNAFQFIKNHYKIINICAGIFLIIIGISMVADGIGGYQKRIEMLESSDREQIQQEIVEEAPEAQQNETEETPEESQTMQAPDFTVEDGEGNPVTLSSLQGKPVILNFWASWCPPCKGEMPDFQTAYESYGEDIRFVMVNLTDGGRETKEKAQMFIEESGYTFPVYYDVNMEAAFAYYISSVPATFFIDAEGNIIAHGVGMLDASSLQQGIDMLLQDD